MSAETTYSAISPGRILGRCRLVREIGRGAMGAVWEARHETLGISVAVKVLRDPLVAAEAGGQRERFRREAMLAARLDHPGLVRVLDSGEEAGRCYLVMELVPGRTLEQYLEIQPVLPERLALQVVGHVCSALAAAHAAGIVHRDVKPANILVDKDGRLKLSDLGLARDLSAPTMTAPDGILGTPLYIAPEAIDGDGAPDHRADLYSVGVLLYRMLYGKAPFAGGAAQILHAHVSAQPDFDPPPGTRISGAAMDLLRRLLQKRPERRFGSATEVVEACRAALSKADPTSRDGSSTGESGDSRLRKAFSGQFEGASSVKGGRRILHTTWKERILVWGLLLATICAVIGGWLALR